MSRTIRSLFSLTTLVLILLVGRSLEQTLLAWGSLVAMALIYLMIIWIPQIWWTRLKYAMAVSLLMALASLLYLSNRSSNIPGGLLLVPLVLLLAREQQRFRWFLVALAAVTMAAMCLLAPDISFTWTVLPVVIALYMSVRAINVYKEAYKLSQQNIEELRAANQELQKTYAALQEATVRSMHYAALAERTRLARVIHDGLGHHLTSLIVQLQALDIMLPGDPARAAKAMPDLLHEARKAMAEVHQAVKTWREDESRDGLVALQGIVSEYAALASFILEFKQEGELSDWPDELSVSLYRILQEALTNIMRHARATTACVQVQENEDQVILTVSDDGCYVETSPLTPGYGIKGIIERTQALGGVCYLTQNQPHGLKLQVSIPFTLPQVSPLLSQPDRTRLYG